MGRIFAVILALWVGAGAQAQQDRAITDVIGGQLSAFGARDVAAAWDYASPNIQRLFGTQDQFAAMVAQGYPMVWDHAEVRYLDLREIAGYWWQKVMIHDASGGVHLLDYQMVQVAGDWRINGVQVLRAPDLGV